MTAATLATLAAFPSQLEAHYAAVPVDYAHWTPPSWYGIPSERFTATAQVCHVRDIEIIGYHARFDRALHMSFPFLADIDSYALAAAHDYANADAQQALREFRVARAQTIALLSQLTSDDFARTALFEDIGPVNVRCLMHYLCSHDQQHLAGLQWLRAQIETARAPIKPATATVASSSATP